MCPQRDVTAPPNRLSSFRFHLSQTLVLPARQQFVKVNISISGGATISAEGFPLSFLKLQVSPSYTSRSDSVLLNCELHKGFTDLVFGRYPAPISVELPAILTKASHGFIQPLQVNVG